jgi:glyoxylase-like metal-dependent hydrolase (beta-lactamase superfamily II)
MLNQVADGVWVRQSEWVWTNSTVVRGDEGLILVDPGIDGGELSQLADDVDRLGVPVVAGFSTHPHWDHLLWHPRFGAAPRHATARAAATARERLSGADAKARVATMIPPDIVEHVPLDLLGRITGLPAAATHVPWDGPRVRIIEHQAHAPGHAALLVEERGVLLAGDMLSDVLIPIVDLAGAADPIGDYLAALRLLEDVAGDVDVLVPGHGSVAGQVRARVDQDRAYVHALRDGEVPGDPRIGPAAGDGWEWVAGVHERQRRRLAGTGA